MLKRDLESMLLETARWLASYSTQMDGMSGEFHTHTHACTLIGALTPPCRQREEMGLNERRKSWKRS
jgi:hypothetical protein